MTTHLKNETKIILPTITSEDVERLVANLSA